VYCSTKYAIEAISDALRFEVRGFGIDVVVVEPGPIRTEFTGAAGGTFPTPGAAGGIYDELHAAVAKGDAETDESFLAGDAEDVAKAIERAIRARRPKPRYKVTAVSRLLPRVRGLLGDRGWDLFLRTQAPRPGSD
jgi:short-subunit dehydrogenase